MGPQSDAKGFFRRILSKAYGVDSQIDCLDGLRGVAVMFVMLSHLSGFGMHLIPGVNFMGTGKFGVWLFFVLSSFLLTSQLLHKSDSILSGRVWLNYGMRRILRIFPLYSVVLSASCLFAATPYFEPLDWRGALRHLAMLAGNGVFWTIPVEVKFYAVLPVIVLCCVQILKMRFWAVSIFYIAAVFVFAIWPLPSVRFGLGRYITVFLTGMYAAHLNYCVLNSGYKVPALMRRIADMAAWAITMMFVIMTPDILSRISGAPISIKYFFASFTKLGILWAVFLLCVIHGSGGFRRVLSSPVLRLLGILSFGMYLWHMPVCNFLQRHLHLPGTLKAYLSLLCVILVALVSHILVERPLMRIRLSSVSKKT